MKHEITAGSGNVFADLGFENPDEELLRAELALRVRTLISERKLNLAKAAQILQIDQPDVASLVDGSVSGFSLERLFGLARRLGDDIEVTVRPSAAHKTGRMLIKVA
jgi:predicted XRE-type DNA-binding protein